MLLLKKITNATFDSININFFTKCKAIKNCKWIKKINFFKKPTTKKLFKHCFYVFVIWYPALSQASIPPSRWYIAP